MTHEFPQPFAAHYESLLKRLKLRGMQPKTIGSYSHGVRRAAAHFDYRIDDLNKEQVSIGCSARAPKNSMESC